MSMLDRLLETQEFATLPPVAARVLHLLEYENVDIRDISRVIETDASLTLKLLRVANSPLYATRSEVNTVHQAIINLGLNRLTNIVLGVSIFSKFLLASQQVSPKVIEKFWFHSSCTGMVAKSLSVKLKRFYKEYEFIGGLLHEIGKLAMIQFDSAKYLEVIKLVEKEGFEDLDAEKKVFEITHYEVGEAIAKLWKLPAEMTEVIGKHHFPSTSDSHKELVAVVRFADLLAEVWDAGFYEGLKILDLQSSEPWQILTSLIPDLTEMDLEAFTFELEQDFKNSILFLDLISS
ncbi:MAG: HDOD domain-containing protein [Candidatus Kapaibacteriota bacterium]